MKRYIYILALVALYAITGCQKQDSPLTPQQEPVMMISVQNSTDDPKFTFLFWEKEDFERGLTNANQGPATPYYIANPTGEINNYQQIQGTTETGENKTLYNTGRIYPENYGVAVCTGYGPYGGINPKIMEDSGMTDYRTLVVASPGATDALVSQNYLEGSSLNPFSGNLEFFHPQIQLTIFAKLAGTMAKYIKDVSFTIPGEYLLESLAWDYQAKGYRPSAQRNALQVSSTVLNEYLNSTDDKTLGTVYVVPKADATDYLMETIDIIVSGKIDYVILKSLGKNEEWLLKELSEKGYILNEILVACIIDNKLNIVKKLNYNGK